MLAASTHPASGANPASQSGRSEAPTGRIAQRFAALRREGRTGLATFLTAGDPDFDSCLELLLRLPSSGADVVELGMPFSDPMADGPAIQASSQRALRNGACMGRTLELLRRFRAADAATPVVLMGYCNPVHAYGVERFLNDAAAAGMDGLILVDMPPEESGEILPLARERGIDFIRLATPTTDAARLPVILEGASGFIYYVSVAGITGTKTPDTQKVRTAIAELRRHSDLPVAIGFGIRAASQAAALRQAADAVVVGSALVERIADARQRATIPAFVAELSAVLGGKHPPAPPSGHALSCDAAALQPQPGRAAP